MSSTESFIEDNQIVISKNAISFKNLKNGGKIEKLFTLTLQEAREQFKKTDFQRKYEEIGKAKSTEVEDYKMIPFAYMYYYMLAKNLRVPMPDELAEEYINTFCVKNPDGTYKFKDKYLISTSNLIFNKNDLIGRIFRAYNSYNRELDLLLQLREKFKGKAVVKYDSVADLCCGVDLIVTTYNKVKPKEYGLASYVSTSRSSAYKYRKNTLRHDYSKLNMIDVIAHMGGTEKNIIQCGDVFTYESKVIDKLYKEILD